jgi:hypothetical protein
MKDVRKELKTKEDQMAAMSDEGRALKQTEI